MGEGEGERRKEKKIPVKLLVGLKPTQLHSFAVRDGYISQKILFSFNDCLEDGSLTTRVAYYKGPGVMNFECLRWGLGAFIERFGLLERLQH